MNPRIPLSIGVTGGIGSGKSIVCRIFSMLGAPVYDSDARARELMCRDAALAAEITAAFGGEAYRDGRPDRQWLASRVFGDRRALARLNGIVHPAVMRDFGMWARRFTDAPYVIMESAIIFENDLEKELDRVIAVSAPEEVRIGRTVERDGTSREKVLARMSNQLDNGERGRRADFTIVNDGRQSVWEQVLSLDKKFRNGI